ncbi:membrane protein [Arthrobacter phage Racecar]|nr:hypothetical protein PBI_RACECAR_36 [Arthrobacter phage Racecar]QFG12720.1 hypothetical protein PBI_MIMI_36 [Arthrobacter phage Mimi]
MVVAIYTYLFITALFAVVGVILWWDSHEECDVIGSRMFFLSPIWPLAGLYFIVKEARKMWKSTGWSR